MSIVSAALSAEWCIIEPNPAVTGMRRRIVCSPFGPQESPIFPMLLLWIVEVGPFVKVSRRQGVCRKLLDTDDKDLRHIHQDIALKIKHEFAAELERCAGSGEGECPMDLFIFILMWRAFLSGHTQDIEGLHSVLQAATSRAPAMKFPTANNRLTIKCSDPITPDECCSLDSAVNDEMLTPWHANRFALPASSPDSIPPNV